MAIWSLYLWPFFLFLCYLRLLQLLELCKNIILKFGRIRFPIHPSTPITVFLTQFYFSMWFWEWLSNIFAKKNHICALFVIHAFRAWAKRVFMTWGIHTLEQWTTFRLFCEQRGRLKLSSYKTRKCYVTTPWVFDRSKNHTWVEYFLLGSLLCKGKLVVLLY